MKQGGPGTSVLSEEGRGKLLTLRYPVYSGQLQLSSFSPYLHFL